MCDYLHIRFKPAEGAVIRIIGLIERRGFLVRGIDLPRTPQMEPATLSLDVKPRDADRRLDVLCAQLARLHDILAVEIETAPALEKSA